MKVWKSPVFYFGIVLVLAVLSAMLAPFVVDWGSYRAGLEAYGEKLTGRKVEIAGPIGVRLFPWPRLAAQDVRIGNPEGSRDEWLATAGQIVVRMNLGSLFNAEIQVESIMPWSAAPAGLISISLRVIFSKLPVTFDL